MKFPFGLPYVLLGALRLPDAIDYDETVIITRHGKLIARFVGGTGSRVREIEKQDDDLHSARRHQASWLQPVAPK